MPGSVPGHARKGGLSVEETSQEAILLVIGPGSRARRRGSRLCWLISRRNSQEDILLGRKEDVPQASPGLNIFRMTRVTFDLSAQAVNRLPD